MDVKRLETRVRGVNRANEYANALWPRLIAVFTPFVGEKIEKADGTLLLKVQKLVDALKLPNCATPNIMVYRHNSNYNLAYTVKTDETYSVDGRYGHAYYHETTIYLGKMDCGVLTQLDAAETFKTDYTAAEVIANREAYKAAKAAADAAQSKLYPFGEYDR